MQAFSVGSEYISDLIAGLNPTLVTAMSASAFSATTLPSLTFEFYNATRAIPAFLVIVKSAL